MPKYTLALKATSKNSDRILPLYIRACLARYSQDEEVTFVVSEHLITPSNGCYIIYTWVDKRATTERKAT